MMVAIYGQTDKLMLKQMLDEASVRKLLIWIRQEIQ